MAEPIVFKPVEAQADVSRGMLEALAISVRAGRVRAVAACAVEAGPDMYVTRHWAGMSGRITLTGGLFELMQAVSNG